MTATRKPVRTAHAVGVVWEIVCPYCHESAVNPQDESHMWETGRGWEKQHTCGECGETFRLPSKLFIKD